MTILNHRITHGLSLVAWIALVSVTGPAIGINIILNFESGKTESPGFDPTGALFTAQMEHVESFFQGAFQDSHTITINYWYEDLDGATGKHSLVSEGGSPHRETEANVRIDTKFGVGGAERNWFVDATPSNNSEFDMQQSFWRDLSGTDQIDWYTRTGTVPETFETAYMGAATDADAIGRPDMLSVVFQEVGHALGMSAANDATQTETNDGDYDFDSDFVFGTTLAVETKNESGDDNLDIAHLENPDTVMFGSIGSGRRVLPSHTDLFAMASGSSFTSLDVPRREFYGNSNWQNSNNWSGDEVPESGDDVYIREAQGSGTTLTAGLTANGLASNLFVSEGARADTNAFKLDVGGDVTVSDSSSRIFINPSGELEADEVFIQNTAQIRMSGGTLDARRIEIDSGASLEGFGAGSATVQVDTRLVNNGLIDVDASGGVGSTLTFVATSAASPWDLDGTSGGGRILANGGDILFNSGSMSDSFGGEIEVAAGYRFHFANSWTNNSGLFDLNGGTTFSDRARITGGTITFTGGEINANVGGTAAIAHIDSAIVISGGTVTVGLDDHLELNGTTTINGGTFSMSSGSEIQIDGAVTFNGGATFNMTGSTTGDSRLELNGATTWSGGTTTFNNGVVQQDGAATVTTDTTVNAGVYDLDGFSGAASWTINKKFTLAADQIDTGNNIFNGTMNINNPGIFLIGSTSGGALALTLPGSNEWTLSGTANVDGSVPGGFITSIPSVFQGSPVNITGTLNVQDRAGSSARVDLSGDITTADAGSLFRFVGGTIADPNRILGGQVTGPGTLGSTANHALIGFGTIATTIDFDGNAELLADDGTLIINGLLLVDVGTIGTADVDGVLSVTGSWNTSVAEQVELQGGSIVGGTITNDGLNGIRGNGTLAARVINNTRIDAQNGTLIVETLADDNDWDGSSEVGQLNALTGNLELRDDASTLFDGTVDVGSGQELFTNGFSLEFQPNATLNLAGGTFRSTHSTNIGGTVTVQVGAPSTISSPSGVAIALFENTSMTTLNGDLQVGFRVTQVEAGATFAGGGSLVNLASRTLRLNEGAVVGVQIENQGRLDLDLFGEAGQADAANLLQTASGTLNIDLLSTSLGDFDQLVLSGMAQLAGTLEVSALAGFNPILGDFYTILSTVGGILGDFDAFQMPLLDPDLAWSATISDSYVLEIVEAGLLGDYNMNGIVDAADYTVWLDSLGQFGLGLAADGNGNLVVDQADYDLWKANFGNTSGLGTGILDEAAVPEPAALVLLLTACVMACGRRKFC